MSLWCYLVLLMILGFCHSAILRKDSTSKDEVIDMGENVPENVQNDDEFQNTLIELKKLLRKIIRNKKKSRPTSTPTPGLAPAPHSRPTQSTNTGIKPRGIPLKQEEWCIASHRSPWPDYCNYIAEYGNRFENNEKVLDVVYEKPPTQQIPYTFTVEYPQLNEKNNKPINFLMVEDGDNRRSNRIFSDDMIITQGGIGHTSVTLSITTQNRRAAKYKVCIYVKSN